MVHGVSDVPPQRSPERDGADAGRDVLRSLGIDVLIDMIEKSSYGVCITGDDHTWVYLNPAGTRLIGKPFEELNGTDYLHSFPPHEREALLALESEQREGDTGFYTNTIVREDGTECEMTWSGTAVQSPIGELAPAIFHDTSGIRRAHREAAALATAADSLAAGGDTGGVLDALAEAAVATTRAAGCVVLVAADALSADASGPLRLAGSSGARGAEGSVLATTLERVGLALDDIPGGKLLTARRPVLLGDHRRRLVADTAAEPLARVLCEAEWEGSALVPLRAEGQVIGCLMALLPPDVRSPSEEETTFWSSLADQASAALTADRLRAQVGAAAATSERLRIGRDLHDSVSHELFALRQRAELVERALGTGDDDLLRAAAADIKDVAQQAITDLRALLAELRPVPDEPDLAHALGDLATQVHARHGLPVSVHVDTDAARCAAGLGSQRREHLRLVAAEALHNVVKHAGATSATVSLSALPGEVMLAVRDDGRGHDGGTTPGGHGMRTMRERVALCGGTLTVTSACAGGTEVAARVPLP